MISKDLRYRYQDDRVDSGGLDRLTLPRRRHASPDTIKINAAAAAASYHTDCNYCSPQHSSRYQRRQPSK